MENIVLNFFGDYNQQPSKDFTTHQNYLEFLSIVSGQLSCQLNKTYKSKILPNQGILNKVSLINLTLESIDIEIDLARDNSSYARLLAIWLPVKGYYSIYHLICLFHFLDTSVNGQLNGSHLGSIKLFTKSIQNGEIKFKQPHFNWIFTGKDLKTLPILPGANLKNLINNHDERCIQILRMIHRYKTDDLRRKYGGSLRCSKARQEREVLNCSSINIFEILYWYRIRANYKDLDIIEENLLDSYYLNYVDYYYIFLTNYVGALKELINTQAEQRGLSSQINF